MDASTPGAVPDGGDPDWRFDPDDPPDRFTRRMLGRMSIAHLLWCADHDSSPLDQAQQASFDEAYAELNSDISRHIGTTAKTSMPRLEFKSPWRDIDFSSLMPAIDLASISDPAYQALNESTRASFERIRQDLSANLGIAQRIGMPTPAPDEAFAASPQPSQRPGRQESDNKAEGGSPEPLAPSSDVTPDELLRAVDDALNQLALLGTVVELLEEQRTLLGQQGEVVNRQQASAARGAVFYVVVGLGSALSGIATLVGLGTATERVVALLLTALLALAALCAYMVVRHRQGNGDQA